MRHCAKTINSYGDWELFYKPWSDGVTARKVLRNKKIKLDIINLGQQYKIYSSFPIKEFSLVFKSASKCEPRPYYYEADKKGIESKFVDLNHSLLDKLDSNVYKMKEIGM